ncbi:hypothetical protein [Methylobacterium sp. P5_C11]
MARVITDRHAREIAILRAELSGLAVGVKLIRLERVLNRKYRPDQPRAPAGQSDGGRWTSDGADGASAAQSQTEDAVLGDGSRVLSIRIRARPHTEWDEQHTVTGPDGTRTVFETSGLTQTIRDGDSGEILARSVLTQDGAEPEAFVQPARSRPRPDDDLARRFARTLDAAGSLFSVLSGRNTDNRKAIFTAPASEYIPGDAYDDRAMWVGAIGQSELDQLCPRNREVQAIADSVAADVRASGNYFDGRDFGNKVHAGISGIINSKNDPNLLAETSYDATSGADGKYGARGTIRLDVLEHSQPSTVCVYDHKTGDAHLRGPRAIDVATVVQRRYPGILRYILIQIKPMA